MTTFFSSEICFLADLGGTGRFSSADSVLLAGCFGCIASGLSTRLKSILNVFFSGGVALMTPMASKTRMRCMAAEETNALFCSVIILDSIIGIEAA
ncbi:hypothetical protein [Candidatus Magnetominusculus dajiuhuensis]|uniref:hypothetical protein n=1 Tax=Candidatus Magnetominusculus dajiuhuensis TaxID=3137712 RepID=UPI003B43176D